MGKNDLENCTFIDIISILSFIIGLENLELNQQQVSGLDKHLSDQDDQLLAKIIQQNDEIIRMLEDIKTGGKL